MIIVTSGHVDHGKTALLQALTGTHTAHLPEEKKRGMTIDLGYAYLPLANPQNSDSPSRTLGFIDVPGHEKFLANMLAGLGGIHYAMLIVSADEGVQAQTAEHLATLRLLDLAKIIVVITKSDRASSLQIEQLKAKLAQDYPFLAESPIFITSAQTGQGIAELRDFLANLVNLNQQQAPFRYAIDRVFSLKGVGTVVTGTAFSGEVKIDDELFLSNGQKVRVKNIHSQNQPAEQGKAGERLALNLHLDFDRSQIERGDWLFDKDNFIASDRVSIELQADLALKESQPVHIYHATSRTTGKLTLLAGNAQQSGGQNSPTFLAELLLDKPLFLCYGDKLILRTADAKQLLGGAKVLEIQSPKRHKRSPQRLALLSALADSQSSAERIDLYLQNQAVSLKHIAWIEQLHSAQLSQLLAQHQHIEFQQWAFNPDYQAEQQQKLLDCLADYHLKHNAELGLSKARLYRMACLNQPEKLIFHFIEQLIGQGELAQTRGWLHLPSHRIQFDSAEQALWQQVLAEFEQQNGQAIWVRDMANVLGQDESAMRNFMYKAGKLGYLTAIVKDRFFLTEDLYGYARLVKQIILQQGEISVNQLRDELHQAGRNFGRKLCVQLIEYFDKCGFLRRKGNSHLLRDGEVFEQ